MQTRIIARLLHNNINKITLIDLYRNLHMCIIGDVIAKFKDKEKTFATDYSATIV